MATYRKRAVSPDVWEETAIHNPENLKYIKVAGSPKTQKTKTEYTKPERVKPVLFRLLDTHPYFNEVLSMHRMVRARAKKQKEAEVIIALREAGIFDDCLFYGKVGVYVRAYFESRVRPDVDGLNWVMKCALDAMQDIVYPNDKQGLSYHLDIVSESAPLTYLEIEVKKK